VRLARFRIMHAVMRLRLGMNWGHKRMASDIQTCWAAAGLVAGLAVSSSPKHRDVASAVNATRTKRPFGILEPREKSNDATPLNMNGALWSNRGEAEGSEKSGMPRPPRRPRGANSDRMLCRGGAASLFPRPERDAHPVAHVSRFCATQSPRWPATW